MEELKKTGEQSKKVARKLMAKAYNIKADEAMGMLGDAHSTNYAENREFFMNQNNPANFERTWDTAYYLYSRMRKVTTKTPFDKVMDFSIIKKLGKVAKYAASQKNEYNVTFHAQDASAPSRPSRARSSPRRSPIHFYPNSFDLHEEGGPQKQGSEEDRRGALRSRTCRFVLEEVGKLAAQYGASRIVIEGHTDASMKGKVPFSRGRSSCRKTAPTRSNRRWCKKFKSLAPQPVLRRGHGLEEAFGQQDDPMNHAKNRRVEIKVFPLEKAN
jgi:hypothetical protein